MTRIAGGLLLLIAALAGCRDQRAGGKGAGQITVGWTGAEQGMVAGPATAEWCSISRVLEIQAIRGDTGVAIAIYPAETVAAAGIYRVRTPSKAESLPPAAGVALRWAAQTVIKGFQGESGSVALERLPSGQLSGRLTAVARSTTDTGSVAVTGTFRGLAVSPPKRGCLPPPADTLDAPPDDTLVH
jgi:hypothetical protein